MGKSQTENSYQDICVPGLHFQYTPVQQRIKDNICQAGTEVEQFSSTLSSLQSRYMYYTEWQNAQHPRLRRRRLPTIYTLLRKRRLLWVGHVHRMDDGHMSKNILCGQLSIGKTHVARPQLHYKNVCRRDLKPLYINTSRWKDLAADHDFWRWTLWKQMYTFILINQLRVMSLSTLSSPTPSLSSGAGLGSGGP